MTTLPAANSSSYEYCTAKTEVIAALSDEGIPVTASAAVNICDYPEIKALEDILSLIDNGEAHGRDQQHADSHHR